MPVISQSYHIEIPDALAAAVGRLMLAWGAIDFLLEALSFKLFYAEDENLGEPVPGESRFSERLRIFRRRLISAQASPEEISIFDRLCDKLRKAEGMRNDLAHGASALRDGNLQTWRWERTARDPAPRKATRGTYSIKSLNAAALLNEVHEELRQRVDELFIRRATMRAASHRENSTFPATSAQPGSSNSSN